MPKLRFPQRAVDKPVDNPVTYPRLRSLSQTRPLIRRVIPNRRLGYSPTSSGPSFAVRGIPRKRRCAPALSTYPQSLLLLTLIHTFD